MKTVIAMSWFMCLLGFDVPASAGGQSEEPSLKVLVFPTGVNAKAYLLTVDAKHALSVSRGARDPDDPFGLINRQEQKGAKLAKGDGQLVSKSIEELEELAPLRPTALYKGGWEIHLKTKSKVHQLFYQELDEQPSAVRALVELLFKVSPIPIDMRSYS